MSDEQPEQEPQHSNVQANKVLRVMKGKRLKYTVSIHLKSGSVYELQSDSTPTVAHNDSTRKDVVKMMLAGYAEYVVTEMNNVEIIHCEKNES
jgi:hypothetical protein